MFTPAFLSSDAEFDLRPYFQSRFRMEQRIDRDFFAPVNDDRTDIVFRFRPGFTWTFGKNWSGEVQGEFSSDSMLRTGSNNTDQFTSLSLANVVYRNAMATWTFGRQDVNIGSQRLIGSIDWLPTGRHYDGVRMQQGAWDVFAVQFGAGNPSPKTLRLAGAMHKTPKSGTFGLIFKHDKPGATASDVWTLTHAGSTNRGRFTLEEEVAIQYGRTAAKDLRAWAVHFNASYAPCADGKVFFEYNGASGGGNATTVNTFDNLSATNHKFYGMADMHSWRNMDEIAFGVDRKLTQKLSGKASIRQFWLRDATDGWYGASGALNQGHGGAFIDPTGASGKNLGRELDLEFTYVLDSQAAFFGGVAFYWPGSFVKTMNQNWPGGGPSSTQTWFYLQAAVRF